MLLDNQFPLLVTGITHILNAFWCCLTRVIRYVLNIHGYLLTTIWTYDWKELTSSMIAIQDNRGDLPIIQSEKQLKKLISLHDWVATQSRKCRLVLLWIELGIIWSPSTHPCTIHWRPIMNQLLWTNHKCITNPNNKGGTKTQTW